MIALTQEIVRELLDYDRSTRMFTWRHRDRSYFKEDRLWRRWNTRYEGRRAFTTRRGQYRVTCILGHVYYAHRIARIWLTGIDVRGHKRSNVR
jgi:hypothetical protein